MINKKIKYQAMLSMFTSKEKVTKDLLNSLQAQIFKHYKRIQNQMFIPSFKDLDKKKTGKEEAKV